MASNNSNQAPMRLQNVSTAAFSAKFKSKKGKYIIFIFEIVYI